MNAQDVIKLMNLEPLDKEGGFFRLTYTSVQTAEYMNAVKPIVSAIYYLITPDVLSALDRQRQRIKIRYDHPA